MMRNANFGAAKGRRSGAAWAARLLCALAVPALIVGGSARPAMAQAGAADTRQFKTEGQLPAKFVAALGNSQKSGYNATSSTLMVDGQSRKVITSEIGWADNLIDAGTFAFAPGRAVQGDAWQTIGSDAEWTQFAATLKGMAGRAGNWSFVTLRYLAPAAGGSAALVVPVPIRAVAARDDGKAYVFDLAMPSSFTEALMNRGPTGYNATTETVTVNGQTQDIVTTEIGWENDMIGEGRFAFAPGRAVQGDAWQTVGSASDPEWVKFATKLKSLADKSGSWSFVTLRYATLSASGPQTITVPHSQAVLAKRGIDSRLAAFREKVAGLSQNVVAGTYFQDARIPANLAQVRQAMLEYGNKERLTPNFRSLVGAKVATNLGTNPRTIKNLEGKDEPVMPQPDMVLNETLNKAAQWFAEALATGRGNAHTGPDAWTDPTGKTVKMTGIGDRVAYFGVPADWSVPEIAAPGWGPGDSPYNWMAGDTHYRWYFGVDGTYPEVGYGAAQDSKGKWYYVGLGHRIPPPATAGN